jgi:hypothetical protein
LSDTPYPIDLDSVRRAFPPGTEAPTLLLDFAAWLSGRPWGSVGRFDLVGTFSDQAFWNGYALRNNFGLFMRLPTGSLVGTWYPSGLDAAVAAVVLLDSEGQWQILAASVEGLLARLALRNIEESDLAPDEDVEDATGALEAWLVKRLGVAELERSADMPSSLPDFPGFMEKWYRDREHYWSSHPTMAELSTHLTAHRPEGKNPWESTVIEVVIVGRQYQVRVLQGRSAADPRSGCNRTLAARLAR